MPNLQKGCFELPEDEARHAIKVLRARVGDSFHLIDGKGGFADATIVEVGKRNCVVDVAEIQHEAETTAKLTMIVSPTKQTDRFEWFLEKAVEIGVDRVIPVWTTRSERKVEKHDRWQKVLMSAMKQYWVRRKALKWPGRSNGCLSTCKLTKSCWMSWWAHPGTHS